MKLILLFLFIFISKNLYSQENYPTPVKNTNHLFYIQHSDNRNTFIYDANTYGKNISDENPIQIYRVIYEENGAVKPLTSLQKSMAYGIDFKKVEDNYFEFKLKGNKKLSLYLGLNPNQKPAVFLSVNNKKMYLERMFIQLKKSGIKPTADYILLIGKDFSTGKSLTERYEM